MGGLLGIIRIHGVIRVILVAYCMPSILIAEKFHDAHKLFDELPKRGNLLCIMNYAMIFEVEEALYA